jgi:alpha-glucosidase
MDKDTAWWETGVIYQIYPRSFADSDGDGVGDILGIISRLDYLQWLGVDAVWISPFYPSPMADFGYDVADHCDVDPLFGDLSDFDRLLREAHQRGIRVIIDLVPNHTSDEHPWFEESCSSRNNPKRDWYVWRDPGPGGAPPNNWESIHGGGSSWEWDEETRQYYLHTFQVEQPDLDWHNPEVRVAIYDTMRFWLDRGVDGFRIDALPCLAKDDELRDNPPNPEWRPGDPLAERQRRIYSEDRPEVLGIVGEIRAVADEYEGDRVLIGEAYLPLKRLMEYYGEALNGLHMPFNFGLLLLPEWGFKAVGELVEQYEAALPEGAGPNWVLGNHDNPRIASRVGPDLSRTAQMLLLTLRGVPTLYYGDEICMRDAKVPPEAARDPQGIANPAYNRDPARTPMQWDSSRNAGFSSENVEPWLPVYDPGGINVQAQRDDPRSMLTLVRRLIRLRREFPALSVGSYLALDAGDESLLLYLREHEGQGVLVALNFDGESATVDLSQVVGGGGKILCSTYLDRAEAPELPMLALRPYEGVILLPDPRP